MDSPSSTSSPTAWAGRGRRPATGSPFLDHLFWEETRTGRTRRRLPAHAAYGLLFTYRRSGRSGVSSDGVITLPSQLRSEAQDEATTIRGFDEDHTSVLQSPEVAARMNAFLVDPTAREVP